ncbi:MAG TPA: hypothetical protein VMJ10_21180 [Kofleriaceae bacterium]|nr:hypothetical protein [Kofleriaceae bacterium]
MAKKQTRRSISVSRATYERLKAFCETNNISMSHFVETRVGDFLGETSGQASVTSVIPSQPRPTLPATPKPPAPAPAPKAETRPSAPAIPLTSAAARYAVDPPPPVIKPKQQEAAPKPTEKRPDQIFTF